MKFHKTEIDGVLVIEPTVYRDSRGLFFESYNRAAFAQNGVAVDFVQDNRSVSSKGVLRGLHFQAPPTQQAKLVTVLSGEAFDVVLDLRRGSKTFGRCVTHTLSGENRKMLFVPEGMAHGFLALKDNTHFFYKVSRPHSKAHERGVAWDDPDLKIDWPKLEAPYVLSDKDRSHPRLKQAETFA